MCIFQERFGLPQVLTAIAVTVNKLLSVDKLTYEKALEIALAMESASKDVLELQNKQIPIQKIKIKKHKKKTEVHCPKTEKQPQNKKIQPAACFHCAKTSHKPFECKF